MNNIDEEVVYVDFEPKGSSKIVEHNAIRSGAPTVNSIYKSWKKIKTKLFGNVGDKVRLASSEVKDAKNMAEEKNEEIRVIKNNISSLEASKEMIMNMPEEQKANLSKEEIEKNLQVKDIKINLAKIELEKARIDLRDINVELEKAHKVLSKYKTKLLKLDTKTAFKNLGVKYNTKMIAENSSERKISKNSVRFIFNYILHGDNREAYPEDLKEVYDQVKSNPTGWELRVHGNVPANWSKDMKEKYGYDDNGVKIEKSAPEKAETEENPIKKPEDIKDTKSEAEKKEEEARAKIVNDVLNDSIKPEQPISNDFFSMIKDNKDKAAKSAALELENASLKTELTKAKEENAKLSPIAAEYEQMKKELETLRYSSNAYNDKIKKLEIDMQKIGNELDTRNNLIKGVSSERDAALAENKGLNDKLRAAEDKNNGLEGKIEEMKKAYDISSQAASFYASYLKQVAEINGVDPSTAFPGIENWLGNIVVPNQTVKK